MHSTFAHAPTFSGPVLALTLAMLCLASFAFDCAFRGSNSGASQ